MSIDFLVTSIIVVVSPGTGVLFTLAAGLSRGSRASVVAAFGCTLGIVPHMVAAIMGLGNGISAGVVMTLGADASPEASRTQFLGGWRLCSDLGNATGPMVISAVSAVAPLAAAAVTMGVLTWLGSLWLIKWIPAYAFQRHRPPPPDV